MSVVVLMLNRSFVPNDISSTPMRLFCALRTLLLVLLCCGDNTFFFSFSSLSLSSPFYSLSLLVVAQIRGHIAGSSAPAETKVRAYDFYREKTWALSSLVDSR